MTDDQINALVRELHGRITEVFLRLMAMQTLLQQAGLFSQADVDRREAELRTVWAASFDQHLADLQGQQAQEQLRRLLESFEGTKH